MSVIINPSTGGGGGGGTVTSIVAGNGITLTPNPIVVSGSVAVTVQALLNATIFNDVVAGSPTRGDLIVGNSTPKWTKFALGTTAQLLQSNGLDPVWVTVSADATIASGGALTLATVNATTGSFGDATHVGAFTVNGKGLITAASSVLITGTTPGGSAGGDLSGTYPNPTVAKINTVALGTTTATSGHLLVADGAAWQSVAMSGDATIVASGALTLATVNGNVGSFGDATHVGAFTVNAKGLITAASSVAIVTPVAFRDVLMLMGG